MSGAIQKQFSLASLEEFPFPPDIEHLEVLPTATEDREVEPPVEESPPIYTRRDNPASCPTK